MCRLLIVPLFWLSFVVHSAEFQLGLLNNSYDKAETVLREVRLIKKHFGITKKPYPKVIKTRLLTRHTRARAYELYAKLNILRVKNNLGIIEPPNMEPTTELNPIYTYAQLDRLLAEIGILKLHLGIKEKVLPVEQTSSRTATDSYNLLGLISAELDTINGEAFTPSHVFAEAMRIYEDLDAILLRLGIDDSTTPPRKRVDDKPIDTYKIAIKQLNAIKSIQAGIGMTSIDYFAFERQDVTPSDVYEITQIILSEIQVIKAYIGLNHEITRGAKYYTGKMPSDVSQLMRWLYKKIRLINLQRITEGN
ncbi:MAG: hypothetical protein HQL46_02965 [Gammaproteobacteria bacterium]|nr:hypothetical protein [Gammaproteobacteria bacterium]